MRPTTIPIRFSLELTRDDDHSCRVRVLDEAGNSDALVYEVFVAAEFGSDAQKRALRDVARHLAWYLNPDGDA